MILFDIRLGGRTAKIIAIGVYHSFCDYIDYVIAYCKANEINYDVM